MSEDYNLVRISEAGLDDFAALTEDAFGVRPSDDANRRLFDTSSWGSEFIGYLARAAATDEAAAFYGIFPCRVEYEGEEFIAAQSGSTMTHTRHRRKGLFYKTAEATFDLARDEGIRFIFGFPNPSSYPGFMKMKWTHDGNVNAYHIPVPTIPIGYLASRFSFLEPIYRWWFRVIAEIWRTDYHPFPNSSRREGVGTVVHDKAFLDYKPESERRLMLSIDGTSVWINRQNGRVGIGDIDIANDDKDLKKVIRRLKFLCFLTGNFDLCTYVSPGSRLDDLFQTLGYRPRPGIAIIHYDLGSGLPLDRFKYVYADFDTF